MITIGIETSTKSGGIAVLRNKEILQELRFTPEMTGSQWLIPSIAEIMKSHNLKVSDIDLIGVGLGPGAFTGLRVGLTAAKTIAYFLGIGVAGIPTIDALVHPGQVETEYIGGILDARKGEVYGAIYRASSHERLTEFKVVTVEEMLEGFKDITLVGNALGVYMPRIKKIAGVNFKILPEAMWEPSPISVAELALSDSYPIYSGSKLFQLIPMYIRKSEAEVKWLKREQSS